TGGGKCGRGWRIPRPPARLENRCPRSFLMALVLLDTSACLEILRGHAPPEEWKSHRFCLSTVVEAELWAGVFHSGGAAERVKVQKVLGSVESVLFDGKAAVA